MTVSEAVAADNIEHLRVLLETGGDPNEAETEEYLSPLLEAAYHDHSEAARLLLDAGAEMSLQNEGGETPLRVAIQQGSLDVFRLLIERGCQLDMERDEPAWLLTQSAGQGHLELVEWLLTQGVNVDVTNDSGCTALTLAAKGSHLEVVERLLRAGADVNHRDNDTETVLMWAADHPGNVAVLRVLLAAGADVNAKSNTEGTALSWTVWSKEHGGDREMVEVLIAAGANVNSRGVLTFAAYYGFTEIVRLLLEQGADLSVADGIGQTPLALAKKQGHREIAHLLQQTEADRNLQAALGADYCPPRYSLGSHVRTLTGTLREGWITLAQWHFQQSRYFYFLEVTATTQARKTVSKRYWEDELQSVENDAVSIL